MAGNSLVVLRRYSEEVVFMVWSLSVCVRVQQPEASLSLRQPQIAYQAQRQHCVLNLFLPAGRSSAGKKVWW